MISACRTPLLALTMRSPSYYGEVLTANPLWSSRSTLMWCWVGAPLLFRACMTASSSARSRVRMSFSNRRMNEIPILSVRRGLSMARHNESSRNPYLIEPQTLLLLVVRPFYILSIRIGKRAWKARLSRSFCPFVITFSSTSLFSSFPRFLFQEIKSVWEELSIGFISFCST